MKQKINYKEYESDFDRFVKNGDRDKLKNCDCMPGNLTLSIG